jgi:hypothetical protein
MLQQPQIRAEALHWPVQAAIIEKSTGHRPMQFQLPEHLLKQVVAYDPVLKPIYKKAEQESKPKRKPSGPRMTQGVIDCLVPTNLISAEEQLRITTELNQLESKLRIISHNDDTCQAVFMHNDGRFHAWWFIKPSYLLQNPEVAKQHDYVYGYSYAFKQTPAMMNRFADWNQTIGHRNRKTSPENTIHFSDYGTTTPVVLGRCKMILRTLKVTEQMICDGISSVQYYNEVTGYSTKLKVKRANLANWLNGLTDAIGAWKDTSIFTKILEGGDIRKCVFDNWREQLEKDPEISFDAMLMETVAHEFRYRSSLTTLQSILETPFFKKERNKVFDYALVQYTTATRKDTVQAVAYAFIHKLARLADVLHYYPDLSLDYAQQAWEFLEKIDNIRTVSSIPVLQWLRQNMPASSFIGILKKRVEDKTNYLSNPHSMKHWRTGLVTVSVHELNDTLSMLDTIWKHQSKGDDLKPLELQKPDRWRINEFHDYLQGESFKLSTPNEALPQDLFPQPVKVTENGDKWTFFQPCDVHQLGSWGKAVRNCVGSADNYRKGIKSKTHFIILVMKNNQPRFTVQAKLRNGLLSVEQIADVCNRSLSDEDRSYYQKTFGMAIHMLEAQLKPKSEETTTLELTAQ